MGRNSHWKWLGAAGILATCLGAGLAPVAQEPIDPGYRVVVLDHRTDADPFQLYVFVKPVDQQGRLRVCAGYVAEMSDARFDQFMASLHNAGSFLRIGPPDGHPFRTRPLFLTGTRSLPVGQAPLSDHLPRQRMRANCIDTDEAWRDDYASTDKIALGLFRVGAPELTINGFGSLRF